MGGVNVKQITIRGATLYLPNRFQVCPYCQGQGTALRNMTFAMALASCPNCSGKGYLLPYEEGQEKASTSPETSSPSKNKTAGPKLNIIRRILHSVNWLGDIWGPTPFKSTKVLWRSLRGKGIQGASGPSTALGSH
jgi:hypothetical protein